MYVSYPVVLWSGAEGGRWADSCVCWIDPVVSAAIGTAWCASRVAYTIGYCRKDKSDGSGRQIGVASSFLEMALMVMSGMTGYQMITG